MLQIHFFGGFMVLPLIILYPGFGESITGNLTNTWLTFEMVTILTAVQALLIWVILM